MEYIIRPKDSLFFINLKELWFYRELFAIFAWRDFKVRYKQTFLGIAWAVFQPLVSMIVFTVFFGNLAKIPSGNLPYPLFVLIGLVFWTLFSNGLTHASNSLVENENIIKKVYLPKIALPLSSVLTVSVDFLINLVMLLIVALFYQRVPPLITIVLLPYVFVITILTTSGLGLFLSAVNVKYRDVRYILPFFIQILIFLTPVIYPTSIITKSHRLIYALNPLVGVIESVRAIFSTTVDLNLPVLGISTLAAGFCFLFGLYFFNKTERFFADII
jgi:lipopolysaccharide transport system permease protein